MNNVNFKLLQAFLMVAERGSFRKAADDTQRSPSAVSMQIRDLEAQVGISLFHRSSKEVTLTESGRLLYDQVKRAMNDVQIGLDLLSDEAERRRGRIVVGCAPTLASTRLPNILATFKAWHPTCAVHLQETSTALGLDLLRRDEIEFYLGPSIPKMTGVEFEPIVADPLYACIPATYDRGEKTVSVGMLAEVPLIMLASNTAIRGTVDALAASANLTLRPQFEVQQATTALALAACGLGVALLPRISITHVQALPIRAVPISESTVQREIGIMTLPGHARHGFSARLIDLIKSSLREQFA